MKRTSANGNSSLAGSWTSRVESALRRNQNVIRSTRRRTGLDAARSGEPGINHLRIQKIAIRNGESQAASSRSDLAAASALSVAASCPFSAGDGKSTRASIIVSTRFLFVPPCPEFFAKLRITRLSLVACTASTRHRESGAEQIDAKTRCWQIGII